MRPTLRGDLVLLLAAGFSVGAGAAWSAMPRSEAAARATPAPPPIRRAAAPTLEERAALELARSRAARRRVAPTLERARRVAAQAEAGLRLPGGARLVLGDVTPTYVVASIELVGRTGPSRSLPAEGGVHFAICAPAPQACTTPASGASRAAVREARRHGVELALQTFLETAATLVVVSVPRVSGPPTALVFERRGRHRLAALDGGAADRIAREHLFALAGLVSHSAGRDSLVARSLAPRRAAGAAGDS